MTIDVFLDAIDKIIDSETASYGKYELHKKIPGNKLETQAKFDLCKDDARRGKISLQFYGRGTISEIQPASVKSIPGLYDECALNIMNVKSDTAICYVGFKKINGVWKPDIDSDGDFAGFDYYGGLSDFRAPLHAKSVKAPKSAKNGWIYFSPSSELLLSSLVSLECPAFDLRDPVEAVKAMKWFYDSIPKKNS